MKRYLFSALVLALLVSCGGNNKGENNEVQITVEEEENIDRVEKTKQVFYTLPSPIETALIFESAGITYNPSILNSAENLSNYSTNAQRAINFGVYGADLSYTNIFNQMNGSMVYMNCVQRLAGALGLTSVFESETMDRIEENIENRDSLMTIINDSYWEADAFLKDNEQDNLSVLVVSGGWIESIYLGTQSVNENTPNDEIEKRIADQKYSLDNLVALLKTYKDDEVIKILKMVEDLQLSYDKIVEEEAVNNVTTDESGATVIGGGSTLVYNHDIILEIAKKAEKIRNEIVQ